MAMRRAVLVALLAVILAACGGNGGERGNVAHPLDATLRLNQIQVVGTHNSFHVAPPAGPELTPARDITQSSLTVQLDRQSVRQIELDVHAGPRRGAGLTVFHLDGDEATTCSTFVACLGEVRDWSDRHPGHLPLFILVEPKHEDGANLGAGTIDAEVRAVFSPQHLLTPDDVQGDAPSLREAVQQRGWPLLGAARDKILVVLNDDVVSRAAYTSGETSLRGRAMFVYAEPPSLLAGFVGVPDARIEGPRIDALVRAGYMVRTRADDGGVEARANDLSRANAAFASGAQLVSTDFPVPAPSGYVVSVPGTTARCNPVTLSPGIRCDPGDIERLP